eukprot:gb/GECG01014781.1/.p1 GENE.gb/GECG01014781.1/~~gb/GECG01014781.1/.p1  ORF type:complete len:216 (+),score=26.79 gb/GECG01014781.1/:1-648(+)
MAEAQTTTEKGAPAYSTEELSQRLLDMGQRGGTLVSISGEAVGPRTAGKGSTTLVGGTSRTRIQDLVDAALNEAQQLGAYPAREQAIDLCVLCFEIGATREGRGERTLFVWFFLKLHSLWPEVCVELLPLIPEYASWRSLNQIYAQVQDDLRISKNKESLQALGTAILELYRSQLLEDEKNCRWLHEKRYFSCFEMGTNSTMHVRQESGDGSCPF